MQNISIRLSEKTIAWLNSTAASLDIPRTQYARQLIEREERNALISERKKRMEEAVEKVNANLTPEARKEMELWQGGAYSTEHKFGDEWDDWTVEDWEEHLDCKLNVKE